jgi:GPI-anchor transamidase subunit S
MNSFSVQLLALLGVPSLPPTVRCAQHDSTLTDWQIDALLRRRILENVDKSTETLSSIVQLVDQIQSMPVGAGVKGDVQDALSALEKVSVASSTWASHKYAIFILGLYFVAQFDN